MFSRVYITLKWMLDRDWQILSLDLVGLAMSITLIKHIGIYYGCLEKSKL